MIADTYNLFLDGPNKGTFMRGDFGHSLVIPLFIGAQQATEGLTYLPTLDRGYIVNTTTTRKDAAVKTWALSKQSLAIYEKSQGTK